MYHGTSPENAASIFTGGFHWTDKRGDFSPNGGVYLAKTMRSAGQFHCNPGKGSAPTQVSIVEVEWNGQGKRVKEFKSKDKEWEAFTTWASKGGKGLLPVAYKTTFPEIIKTMDMVAGPMGALGGAIGADKHLTDNFYQYAVIKENQLSSLTRIKVLGPYPCTLFPAGQLSDSDTAGPSNAFSSSVRTEFGMKKKKKGGMCIIM